jgi:hypothetical protein
VAATVQVYTRQAPRCRRRCRGRPGRQTLCHLGSRQPGCCRLACARTASRGTGSRCCSTMPVGRRYTCAATRPLCWRRRRSKRSRAHPGRRTHCCPRARRPTPGAANCPSCSVRSNPQPGPAAHESGVGTADHSQRRRCTGVVQHGCAINRTGESETAPKAAQACQWANGPSPPHRAEQSSTPAARGPWQLEPASRCAGWLGARSAPPCDAASCRQTQHIDVSATSAPRQHHVSTNSRAPH